jgi:regulator of protease activity HflC (stomatin/prohibitin superfamily)
MFGIKYFKADSNTYVIRSSKGKAKEQGKGLSFFYNTATTSIAAVPTSVQEAPFIFRLQTSDFQEVTVQGQIAYRLIDPEVIAEMLNFTIKENGKAYVSEDPLKLNDRVVRSLQSIVQARVQDVTLRESLVLGRTLVEVVRKGLGSQSWLAQLGITIVDVTFGAIAPSPETIRALEAEAREAILKEADDAIYARRKFAVEQERTIKEAELQTELLVQDKEQEIEESRIENERALFRGTNATEKERLEAEIETENRRKELVDLSIENARKQADSEAYAVGVRMRAFTELPVENLKAMAMMNMQPEQLMALSFESFAQNAEKIGELNIGPEMFGQMMKKAVRK